MSINPLKASPASVGHINDVIQQSENIGLNNEYYEFPMGVTNGYIPNDLEVLLLAFNCSGEWINNTCGENATINATLINETTTEDLYDTIFMYITSVFLGLMILITVIGNVFVIAAILLERNLQNVANYLIVSLAVADLMVACLVMPLGAVYEISKGWSLGPEVCDMWTSSDVLCCTASILHLVAIAVDRYWAVTNVDYIHTRNGNRIGTMIILVWTVAIVVSLAPQFGWKDDKYLDRINLEQRCLPSQDIGYQIFATCSTFYVPLLVILILYWKIFQTARKRIHRRRDQRAILSDNSTKSNNNGKSKSRTNFLKKRKFLHLKKCKNSKKSSAAEALVSSLVLVEGQSTSTVDVLDEVDEKPSSENKSENPREETTAFIISKDSSVEPGPTHPSNCNLPPVSYNVSPEKSSATTTNNGSASHQSHMSDISRIEILTKETTPHVEIIVAPVDKHPPPPKRDKKESLEAKRERKAAKTLAIITGAFVMCWLPFFVMALVMPLCATCVINDYAASFFLWLGYFNSTLNPVIYTIFSPEFRQAFTRILCGTNRARNQRNFRSGKLR